jgi:hypothetical protein
MKSKFAMIILQCLLLVRCATYYHLLGEDKNTFYTDQQKIILEKTLKSIDFDYGYSMDVDLNYLYPLYQGLTEFKPGDKELVRAIDGMDAGTLISYSEKIYWLKSVAAHKMRGYEKSGDWKNYTYVEKYLLPPIKYYSELLEKQALKKDKNYADQIEKRKKAIDRKVLWNMRREEFEALWKYDYNS